MLRSAASCNLLTTRTLAKCVAQRPVAACATSLFVPLTFLILVISHPVILDTSLAVRNTRSAEQFDAALSATTSNTIPKPPVRPAGNSSEHKRQPKCRYACNHGGCVFVNKTQGDTGRCQCDPPYYGRSCSCVEERFITGYYLAFFYERVGGGNILKPSAVEAIRRFETSFYNSDFFTESCTLSYHQSPSGLLSSCRQLEGAMDFLYPRVGRCDHATECIFGVNCKSLKSYCTEDGVEYIFDGRGTILAPWNTVLQILNLVVTNSISEDENLANFFLSRDATVRANGTESFASAMRSSARFGLPVSRNFCNEKVSHFEQEQIFGHRVWPELRTIIEELERSELAEAGIAVSWIGDYVNEKEIVEIVTHDAIFAIAGVACIFLYVAIHLRSAALALAVLLQVALSVPPAYIVVQWLFQVQWTNVLNSLALFVILGIAVDDCLVFGDTFASTQGQNIEVRLSLTYSKAGTAIFTTSCTDFFAFAANLFSPIFAVRSFGIFVALLCAFNWILVVTYFAMVLYWRARWLEERRSHPRRPLWQQCFYFIRGWLTSSPPGCPSEKGAGLIGDDAESNNFVDGTAEEHSNIGGLAADDLNERDGSNASLSKHFPREVEGAESDLETRLCDVVDDDPLSNSHNTRSLSWLKRCFKIARERQNSASAQYVGISDERNDSIARDEFKCRLRRLCCIPRTMGKLYNEERLAKFTHGKRPFALLLILAILIVGGSLVASGIQPPATDAVSFFPPENHIQRAMDMRRKIFYTPFWYYDVSVVWGVRGLDRSTADPSNPKSLGTASYVHTFNLSDPVAQSKALQICGQEAPSMSGVTDVSCVLVDFQNWLQQQGMSMPLPASEFRDAIATFLLSKRGKHWRDRVGWDEGGRHVQWLSFTAKMPVYQFSSAALIGPEFDRWELQISRWNKNSPPSLAPAMHVSAAWIELDTQTGLQRSATLGLAASMGFAAFLVGLATRNLRVTILVIFVLSASVATILAALRLSGATLGPIESMCVCILTGISMDYGLHIGVAFAHSDLDRSCAKAAEAANLIPSIAGASFTTALSATFLLFATLHPFVIFGRFMVFSALISFMLAVTALPVLLAAFGDGRGGEHGVEALMSSEGVVARRLPLQNDAADNVDGNSASLVELTTISQQ